MDPALFSPPEVILNGRNPLVPASQERRVILTSSQPSLQTSRRVVGRGGPLPPSDSDHVTPSLAIQPGLQTPTPQLSLIPFFPELILSPVTFTPTFTPRVLFPVGGPPEPCCGPGLPPQSWILLPDVRPSWCVCPQAGDVRQTCGDDLVSAGSESEEEEEEEEEEEVKSEDEQNDKTPNKEELHANSKDDQGGKALISASLDEELLKERAFDDYMAMMDSLTPEIQEGAEAEGAKEEKEEEEEEERGNSSLLAYLDKMCNDDNLMRKVDSLLDPKLLDPLFPSDPEPADLLPPDRPEQECLFDYEVESRPDPEDLDPRPSSDPDLLVTLGDLLRQTLAAIQQLISHLSSANANSIAPVTTETASATVLVQETTAVLVDPPGSESDVDPDHDAPPRSEGPEEAGTSCSLLLQEPLSTDDSPPSLASGETLALECSLSSPSWSGTLEVQDPGFKPLPQPQIREPEEQRRPKNRNPLTKTPQEEREFGRKRKEEETPTSSCVKTRSKSRTEERGEEAGGKTKHGMERRHVKRDLEVKLEEEATLVKSSRKRKNTQRPEGHVETRSTKGWMRKSAGGAAQEERSESPSGPKPTLKRSRHERRGCEGSEASEARTESPVKRGRRESRANSDWKPSPPSTRSSSKAGGKI